MKEANNKSETDDYNYDAKETFIVQSEKSPREQAGAARSKIFICDSKT